VDLCGRLSSTGSEAVGGVPWSPRDASENLPNFGLQHNSNEQRGAATHGRGPLAEAHQQQLEQQLGRGSLAEAQQELEQQLVGTSYGGRRASLVSAPAQAAASSAHQNGAATAADPAQLVSWQSFTQSLHPATAGTASAGAGMDLRPEVEIAGHASAVRQQPRVSGLPGPGQKGELPRRRVLTYEEHYQEEQQKQLLLDRTSTYCHPHPIATSPILFSSPDTTTGEANNLRVMRCALQRDRQLCCQGR
jgi:hypothetical protein